MPRTIKKIVNYRLLGSKVSTHVLVYSAALLTGYLVAGRLSEYAETLEQ